MQPLLESIDSESIINRELHGFEFSSAAFVNVFYMFYSFRNKPKPKMFKRFTKIYKTKLKMEISMESDIFLE